MKNVEEIFKQLSPDLQREVIDFAEFLSQRSAGRKQKRLNMRWAGGLREFRAQFTSLELQKKALEWWSE
jgi:hypothetical protein